MTRTPSLDRPGRGPAEVEPPHPDWLLGFSLALGACRDLPALGSALFQRLREELPVDRMALWFGDDEEGPEVVQWAAELAPDGVLAEVVPVAGWVELTRNLQEPLWDLAASEAKACPRPVPADGLPPFPSVVVLPLRTPERLVGGMCLSS